MPSERTTTRSWGNGSMTISMSVKTCGPPAEGKPEIGNPTFFIQILEHN